jgi:hypothetical protein
MPWESIGSVSTGSAGRDDDWIEFGQLLALRYIRLVCGNPPLGVELSIMSHDHDDSELSTYTSIGLYSDFTLPTDYVSACERALNVFDEAVNWFHLKEHFENQLDRDDRENEI